MKSASFASRQNALPLQLLKMRLREVEQELLDRLPLHRRRHLHAVHQLAGYVFDDPGTGLLWLIF